MKTHFDRASFLQSIDNDEELFREIVGTLNFEEMIEDYRHAYTAKDLKRIYAANHKIKGISRNMFFLHLIELCLLAERDIKNGDFPSENVLNKIFEEMIFIKKLLAN